MLKNFKNPEILVRLGLGALLLANLVAAAFAFNLFGTSPEALQAQLLSSTSQLQTERARLDRARFLSGNIGKGKTQSETFLATYLTDRRHTYSTIISEINDIAKQAGMKTQEWTIAPLDPIEGSDDLDMMTISVNFEGLYPQLVKFVNAIDRSQRFLIIDSMQVAPEAKGDQLTVTLKLNTFVKDLAEGAL